jgi:hypothetical protein
LLAALPAGRDVEPFDAIEDAERQVLRGAAIQRVAEERSGVFDVALVEGHQPFVDERLGLPLPLGLCAPGAFDVGPGPIVMPVEEQHTGPDVDGRFEVAGEVLIQAGNEELLDARVLPFRGRRIGWRGRRRVRIGHVLKCCTV